MSIGLEINHLNRGNSKDGVYRLLLCAINSQIYQMYIGIRYMAIWVANVAISRGRQLQRNVITQLYETIGVFEIFIKKKK